MKKISILIFILFFAGMCRAQVIVLDLQKCREMAVENSKKLQSTEQQLLKSGYEKK